MAQLPPPTQAEPGGRGGALPASASTQGKAAREQVEFQRDQLELRSVLRHAHTIITHSTVIAPEGWNDPATTWGVERYYWDLQVDDLDAALEAVPLAIEPGEPFHRAWSRAKHPEDRAPMDATATRAFRTGASSYRQEFRLVDRFDRVHWFYQVVAIDMLAPGYWRVTAVNNDISERKRVEEELAAARISAEHAKVAAEVASRAKDVFLAVLSHELRTPLTPVLATAEMMEEDATMSAENHALIKLIRRNVELEARLIDDLLDLTRVAQGKLELHLSVVDVHDKIGHVISLCAEELAAKQIALSSELLAGQFNVYADPARLQQVFWNLIKNAVKFTPVGGSIRVRTANPGAGRITIEVIDDGIGIAPEKLSSIFHAFEQGSREITRRFGGLGLGLAISKLLVDIQGGTLRAFSEGPGRGATFTVELPLNAGAAPPESDRETGSREGIRCRILLVEDHPDTRHTMSLLLRRLGCEVHAAGTVAEALDLSGRHQFDLVVSDIGLPDASGLDLMRQIKARLGLRGIALSGYGMEEDVALSMAAGFDAHLTKPVNIQALEEAIRGLAQKPSR